jgi:hypothetical protein
MRHPLSAECFRADLARIGLPCSLAGRVLGVSRSTVYRWASGQTPISEPARRILKSEVERCMVRQHGDMWQGYRDGKPMGPRVAEKWMAQFFALDLPR